MATPRKRQHSICIVDALGGINCNFVGDGTHPPIRVPGGVGGKMAEVLDKVSPQRRHLIKMLVEEVLASKLTDECIADRTDDVVESVHYILQPTPPVMILFQYVALPGIIMALYYLDKGELKQASDILATFSTLKPAC